MEMHSFRSSQLIYIEHNNIKWNELEIKIINRGQNIPEENNMYIEINEVTCAMYNNVYTKI